MGRGGGPLVWIRSIVDHFQPRELSGTPACADVIDAFTRYGHKCGWVGAQF